jgi:hypothetical protein
MKIGFSFGRCLRDLVTGRVKYEDVLLIYAATNVEEEHLEQMVNEYTYRPQYLNGLDEAECLEMAKRLLREAKIHQPRKFGRSPLRVVESGVWMDLAPTIVGDAQQNELVQKAWNNYLMTLKLVAGETMPEDQFRKRTPEEEEQFRKDLDLLSGCI